MASSRAFARKAVSQSAQSFCDTKTRLTLISYLRDSGHQVAWKIRPPKRSQLPVPTHQVWWRYHIRTLPPEVKRQIKQALIHLTAFPGAGKPLTGELAGLHSYRMRRFRIVYQLTASERRLLVLHVGHRQTVYEELARRLKEPPLPHND